MISCNELLRDKIRLYNQWNHMTEIPSPGVTPTESWFYDFIGYGTKCVQKKGAKWEGSEISKGNTVNESKLLHVCSESGQIKKSALCGIKRLCEACEHTYDSKTKVVKLLKNKIDIIELCT